jgi:carotenoid cleavage dioxygenase
MNHPGKAEAPAQLYRWTIDQKTGAVDQQQLDDQPLEFPRINERNVGQEYRYS